jgi:LuxR family quorum-sensing system transcriptional regulator SolR
MSNNLSVFIDVIAPIMSASSDEQLLLAVSDSARECGFGHVLLGMQWLTGRGEVRYRVASDYPEKWQVRYAENDYIQIDPTVRHCRASTSLIIWSDGLFRKAGALELFEEASGFGLSGGVSVPVHDALGVKSMVSFTRDQPLRELSADDTHMLKAAKVLASVASLSLRRVFSPEMRGDELPKLSASELAALRWVANGKTAWEIGCIMGIAESTVVYHLNNAMRKLGVVNRPQAIAAAFRLGLLD